MTRTSTAIRPLLFADKATYLLGVPDPTKKAGPQHTRNQFQAHLELAKRCAQETGSLDAARVVEFLQSWQPELLPAKVAQELTTNDWLVFRVDDRLLIDEPKVQAFWALQERKPAKSSTSTDSYQCLISGVRGNIEDIMPMPIQGVPDRKGKRENRQIVSADSDAFESYGLKKAQTSPISRGAAERFAKSLNALLRSELHHKLVGNVVYAFWSRAGIVRMLPFEPEFADTATVRDLLDFIRKGERWRTGLPDEEKFHIVGLSANVTRVVVRTHLDTTIGNLAKRQAEWFERLEIVGPNGDLGAPLSLKQLAVAPYRDFKDIAPGVEDALVRAALHSDPLPETLLRAVVMRCRLDAERRVTYPRAALLKYILTQHIVDPLEASTMNQEVTDSDRLPFDTPGERTAYHCGRLFAELEDVQRQALPGINATISDRYFGAASSAPASVFGLLLSGARDHLGKLRKTREGAYIGAERRLEEVLSEIGTFPKTLPLREQALFSLGYYHHKAAKRRDIADRAAAKRQAGQITTDDAAPQGAAAAAETVEE